MKKLTISYIREPLNLLLNFEISQSRFVEMLNDYIGFENENEKQNDEDIIETNENIIYVDNTALNIFILDNNAFIKYTEVNYTNKQDIIRIDLENRNYKLTKDDNKNIISSETLYNIINK